MIQNNNLKAKIIAIEPVGINFKVLSQNIKKNIFPINAEKVALSDKEGTAKDVVPNLVEIHKGRISL